MTRHPEPDETAVRAALHRLGARPAGHASAADAEQQPTSVAVVIPPLPAYEPAVPDPSRVLAPRLPDWRDPHKPELGTIGDEAEDIDDGEELHDAEDITDAPEQLPAESRRRRLLRLAKGERDERGDGNGRAEQHRPPHRGISKEPAANQGEEHEDDGEEDLEEVRRVGERRARRRRATAPPSERRRPRLSTPVFPRQEKERKSFAQAWREIDPATKWGLYHVSGLAGGLAFGVVSFATDVTRSVAESPLPLRENPDAYFWTAGAVLVLALDRVTRRWAWLVGWCARGVTASLIVGALLHGNTVGEALAHMPTLLDNLPDRP
ncbi:hypothetical protein [Streptomyces sp. NPDC051572]|uniref:hypothetical protein n=1 Tax=Streptomyces sp. NPDC051572 TaxID=3155802 RepID=UPI00344EAAA9